MHIKATAILAVFILASGIVSAQARSEYGISAITRDKRSNTNEVVSAKSPKVHISAWFVRLPQGEVADFRKGFSADAVAGEEWQATLSEMDAKKQIEVQSGKCKLQSSFAGPTFLRLGLLPLSRCCPPACGLR